MNDCGAVTLFALDPWYSRVHIYLLRFILLDILLVDTECL